MNNCRRRSRKWRRGSLILDPPTFPAPPLKQIGNSLFEIRQHYMSKGHITIIPSQVTARLADIRNRLIVLLGEDSFLYKRNVATGSTILPVGDKQQCMPTLVVLMDSLALAMDMEVSTRPNLVLCDILLAICGQPIMVITIVYAGENDIGLKMYNTSVARGVSVKLRKFMNEDVNVMFGVIRQNDVVEDFKSALETIVINSSFAMGSILDTGLSTYEKIVNAFWPAVAETRSVLSRNDLVYTDYLRFLTKDQCIILLENINKEEVEVQSKAGTGATTLMAEVARRLSSLRETLLVCRSQKEKEWLGSVHCETFVLEDLTSIDVSRYDNVVDETGILAWESARTVWRCFDTDTSKTVVQLLEQQTDFKKQMIRVLTLFERQRRLDCLSYLKLYSTKRHVYSLLPDADEEEGEDELYKILFPVLKSREKPQYKQSRGVREDDGDIKRDLNTGLVTAQVHAKQTETRNKPINDPLKESSSVPEFVEELKTKMIQQHEGIGSISKLEDKLHDMKKISESQDDEIQKNPTDYLEWKTKADSLVMEMPPISMNSCISNCIGEDVTLTSGKENPDMRTEASYSPATSSRSQVHLLREFQHGRLQERCLRNCLGKAIIKDSSNLSDLEVTSGRLQRVFGPVYIFSCDDQSRSFPVSCPSMALNREQVHEDLAVSGDELTNTESSETEQAPYRFTNYWGTCSALITLPHSPSTHTIPRYWETNSRVLLKDRWLGRTLLEMAVMDEDLEYIDKDNWGYESGSGWSVLVVDCREHPGFCTQAWGKGRQEGDCLPITSSPTPGTYTEFKLGTVVDVGRGRLAFIDVNKERVLHTFDVTFSESPYPLFGVWPQSYSYEIDIRLISGGEITITDSKKTLIEQALLCS